MNNSMIAFCSEAFSLTAQQGQYVNTAFYGAYLLSIPFALLMSKIGYKNTLILGLAVAGIGFVINSIGINSAIAAQANVYAIFLASMCLVAMGVVMLQNVANPYVMVLGSPEKGAFRMTLSQALNSVATTVAPLFVTYVIINGKAPAPEYVPGPFLGLGVFTIIICLILVFLKLPRIDEGAQAEAAGEHREYKDSVFKYPHVWLGALGFTDDYIKVFRHNKEGLSEKAKLIAQIMLGLAIGLTVCFNGDIVVREKPGESDAQAAVQATAAETTGTEKAQDVVKSTKTTIPFVKNHEFDYKWLSPFKGAWGWYCKWAIYVVMIVIVITACSNGTNLTDGMDGLSTGTSAIAGVVLGIFAWLSGNIINSDYLNIMYIPGTGEIAVFMAAFVGALIGFLWYNSFPAQVFMGDTGSLAIGGIIGVCAILIRKELLLPVLCGVFFVESLSVLMQRFYFKYTKKRYGEGRRIFKMAPLHHHFQKEGIPALVTAPRRALPEAKIVVRFWIIGIILAVLTIALLKIR